MSTGAGYAGDVSSQEAWEHISTDQFAVLVDVRTRAEWSYVGIPDLSQIDKEPILVEWQVFPQMEMNRDFQNVLVGALAEIGAGQNAKLYMLCRSGVRSKSAAQVMTAAGYSDCYNVVDGFEGGLDDTGKRGRLAGWKADGLPWRQG